MRILYISEANMISFQPHLSKLVLGYVFAEIEVIWLMRHVFQVENDLKLAKATPIWGFQTQSSKLLHMAPNVGVHVRYVLIR